jgi:hypothetical protein
MSLLKQLSRLPRGSIRPVYFPKRSLGSVSAIDSSIFRTLFGTEEIRKVLFTTNFTLRLELPN